jgi:catalase
LRNGPDSFAGRKIGVPVTDGADAATVESIRAAAQQQKVNVELVGPTVGGVDVGNGNRLPADQKIDGAPSVLYDAVVVVASKDGAARLAAMPAARDFVTDAYAHCKFIGYTADALPLLEATGLSSLMDPGFISLDDHAPPHFTAQCGKLRFWQRQLAAA